MELTNAFDVSAPISTTWDILTDIELIAPCMPGAQLTEVHDETYKGTVKIKVGPITAQFKGDASFVEQDAETHRAVLRAQGRDTGGKGTANATITAELAPADNDGTHVTINTDLAISGRVAQFGRGALADVSTKLLGQFVTCLETRVLSGEPAHERTTEASEASGQPPAVEPSESIDLTSQAEPAGPSGNGSAPVGATPPVATTPRKIKSVESEAIDLLTTAGVPLAKRLIPLAALVAVLIVLLRRRSHRGSRCPGGSSHPPNAEVA